MTEAAELDAEIAIAKARLKAVDFTYLVGNELTETSVARACHVLAYAMLEIMVEAGKNEPHWHAFLQEALDETIHRTGS